MEKTYFEIYTDRFEVRFGTHKSSIPAFSAKDILDTYSAQRDFSNIRVARFETADEARAEWKKNYANYGRTSAEDGFVFALLVGEVAYLSKMVYEIDADGDETIDHDEGWLEWSVEGYEPDEGAEDEDDDDD